MATKTQKVKVGIFLTICMALMVLGFALIAGYSAGQQDSYKVIFRESVLGLHQGGMVQYQGVPVGRVDDIRVGDDHNAHVRILIESGKVTLREGVQAKLEIYSLATGTMCIALFGGDPEAPKLKEGSTIVAEKSLLESVSAGFSDLQMQLEEVLNSFKRVLKGIDEEDLNQTIQDVRGIIAEVKTGLEGTGEGDLADIFRNIKDTLASLNQGLEGMEEGELSDIVASARSIAADIEAAIQGLEEGRLTETINDINRITAKVDAGLEGLKEGEIADVIHKADEAMENGNELLATTTKKLDETTGSIRHSTENLEHSLAQLLRTMEETLEAIQELAEYLREDPSSVIWGPAKR